jgi:hypothetical protein
MQKKKNDEASPKMRQIVTTSQLLLISDAGVRRERRARGTEQNLKKITEKKFKKLQERPASHGHSGTCQNSVK